MLTAARSLVQRRNSLYAPRCLRGVSDEKEYPHWEFALETRLDDELEDL